MSLPLTILLYWPWFQDEHIIYLPIKMYQLHFGVLAPFLSALFYIIIIHFAFTATISVWIVIYVTNTLKFQLYVFKEDIKIIINMCNINSKFIVNDQKNIEILLKNCIKHYETIRMY